MNYRVKKFERRGNKSEFVGFVDRLHTQIDGYGRLYVDYNLANCKDRRKRHYYRVEWATGKKDIHGDDIFEGDEVERKGYGMTGIVRWTPARAAFILWKINGKIETPYCYMDGQKKGVLIKNKC